MLNPPLQATEQLAALRKHSADARTDASRALHELRALYEKCVQGKYQYLTMSHNVSQCPSHNVSSAAAT
eukprot:SAG31_NODE_7250_length_1742_cov_1.572733_2_plen_69_part_00